MRLALTHELLQRDFDRPLLRRDSDARQALGVRQTCKSAFVITLRIDEKFMTPTNMHLIQLKSVFVVEPQVRVLLVLGQVAVANRKGI